jgi:uncharacterized protein (UPF0332 family)
MRQEFRDCLDRGKIIRFPQGKRLLNKELDSARSDLEDANFGLEHSTHKWATIQGYYSMYHAARALIYSRGYRERSHYCLYVALQALFVDRGKLPPDLVESFRHAMSLRETADYRSDFSEEGARLVTESAERLLKRTIEVLEMVS